MDTARKARLFFLRPIKFSIYGSVVAVSVVDAELRAQAATTATADETSGKSKHLRNGRYVAIIVVSVAICSSSGGSVKETICHNQ